MESGHAGELLRDLAKVDGIAFSVPHGGVDVLLEPAAEGLPHVDGDLVRVGGTGWSATVDLRDVNYVAMAEEHGHVGVEHRAVVFADTAGEALLRGHVPNGNAGLDLWKSLGDRWRGDATVRGVSLRRNGRVEDRGTFVDTLGKITEEMRASGRINFVLAVGNSVFEVFPPTVLDRLSVGEGYMTLANEGIHIHVNFGRVESLRFCEEHGGVSGRGLPLSLSVKYCAAGGRTLLKAIFPFPHLDDEFKPCEVQPERIDFFRGFHRRYAGRSGVEALVAGFGGEALPAAPIVGELVAA